MTIKLVERPSSTDQAVIREIWEENVYHLDRSDFAGSGVALDIGANIGAFALQAAHFGARRVIAYEPEEENYGLLLANIAAHPALGAVIEPVRSAIWSHERELWLLPRQGDTKVSEEILAEAQRITALTLDQVVRAHEIAECDVLKLDVEGAEYAIFSALSLEAQGRFRRIVLEFHAAPDEVFGRLVAQLTRTHKLHVLGSVDRGGYIWAERY